MIRIESINVRYCARICVVLGVLFSLADARSAAQTVPDQSSPLAEGRRLIEKGEYAKALRQFARVAPSSPEYGKALVGSMIASITLLEPDMALHASAELCRQRPLDAECHKMRGLLLLMLDRNNAQEALVCLEKARALSPDDETLFLNAGCHAYLATPQDGIEVSPKELDAAIRACDQLISRNAKDYRYFFLRGYCLFEKEEFAGALRDLLYAEPMVPKEKKEQYRWFVANVAIHATEGPISQPAGSKEKCLEYLNIAIEKCPYWPRLYYLRGLVRAEHLSDPTGAIVDYTMALELQPRSDTSHLLRARAYLQQLLLREASADIEAAFSLCDKPSALHYLTRAEICLRNGTFAQAISDSTEAIRLETTPTARMYFVRALAWDNVGKTEDANADRTKGMSLLEQQRVPYSSKEELEQWKRLAPTAEQNRRVHFFVLSTTRLADWLRGQLR